MYDMISLCVTGTWWLCEVADIRSGTLWNTLVNILSLVSHPEGVNLTLDTGCVLETQSTTTTTPQRAVSKPGDNDLVIMMSKLDDIDFWITVFSLLKYAELFTNET